MPVTGNPGPNRYQLASGVASFKPTEEIKKLLPKMCSSRAPVILCEPLREFKWVRPAGNIGRVICAAYVWDQAQFPLQELDLQQYARRAGFANGPDAPVLHAVFRAGILGLAGFSPGCWVGASHGSGFRVRGDR